MSFHWNTGAIDKATWVKLWKARASRPAILQAMQAWSKAGGKVLPALSARREREFRMLMDGQYRAPIPASEPHPAYARWGLSLNGPETRAAFDGLRKMGYDPGAGGDRVALPAIVAFQKDHGLTVDGIIGRATLTALERALVARTKAVAPAAALATVPAIVVSGLVDQLTGGPYAGLAATALSVLWASQVAWSYRDILAAKIAPALPRVAAFLRSF